jgi:hypothetical protein
MAASNGVTAGDVTISGGWWSEMQESLQGAVDGCNHITGLIAAHQYEGKYKAEQLLDHIERDIREIRKLVEAAITPF